VTGVAGFIGMHTAIRLLKRGDRVFGVDNLNEYYDVSLKHARLSVLKKYENFIFFQLDIADRSKMDALFSHIKPSRVIHLAAQAGVRYSIDNPHVYVDSNLQGFINVLEGCKHNEVQHLIYASSSSVYGGNTSIPFKEDDNVDHPLSLYAATKKANELMAHTYSHLFGLRTTGLRFFTVYGPWGRPDMALFLFTKAILAGEAINVFNHGNMIRDFTYIDDIVEAVIRIADKIALPCVLSDSENPNSSGNFPPYRILNVGNNNPTPLIEYISALEKALGVKAKKNFLPMQAGDVPVTAASISELESWINYKPTTNVSDGVSYFVDWYREYYKI
jgi:UDP-glucuronate 4-epimerase